jgi:excisionase family DNA binding protein
VKEAATSADGTREDFLTARQLASILQVSESTVRRLAREERIPSVRITSRLIRFNLKAVRHALDGATRSSRRQHEPAADDPQLSFTDIF